MTGIATDGPIPLRGGSCEFGGHEGRGHPFRAGRGWRAAEDSLLGHRPFRSPWPAPAAGSSWMDSTDYGIYALHAR
jgi:hypothetical protein